jgi:hypothetical protein
MLEDKYIGLILAMSSSIMIGTSFIFTKKGLIDAAKKLDQAPGTSVADTHHYLTNALWWTGMLTMVVGEIANFAGVWQLSNLWSRSSGFNSEGCLSSLLFCPRDSRNAAR